MKNFYQALLATFLLPLFSFAQSNYKPGYVVTLKGDTLHGFIDYREWGSNPNSINFKTAIADNKAREFTPAEIGFFNISGLESYRRYEGLVSMDATDKDHLASAIDSSFRVEAVFFKELQKGKNLALYAYTDNLKSRFYVGEAPDYTPTELGYRVYRIYGTIIKNENTYMKQLFALANKYEGIDNNFQWDIEHAGYNSDDLLKITGKINRISKAEYKKNDAAKGAKFNLFMGAAVNINNITTPSNSTYYAGGGTSHSSYLPAISFGANIFANPSTRQLQFRFEVGVAQSQFKSLYMLKVYPYIPFRASFDELAFSASPQIIYNFYNAENFKFYGGVGLVFSFFKYSNQYLGSQSQPNSASDIQANDPYYFISSDNSFVFKTGVQIHKNWGLFAQYLTSVSASRDSYFRLSSTCEQIGINYFFK